MNPVEVDLSISPLPADAGTRPRQTVSQSLQLPTGRLATILECEPFASQRARLGLTEDDLNSINGRRERLEDTIHKRYGFAADHVRKEVDDWLRWQG